MSKKILIAIILISIVVVLFITFIQYKKDTTSNITPAPTASNLEAKNFSIVLNPQNNSGESGIVLFEKLGDKTLVKINLVGFQSDISQSVHFHKGSCDKPLTVKHKINDVINGKSETVLDVKLEDLLKDLPLVVNVHKSFEEDDIHTACGEVLPL